MFNDITLEFAVNCAKADDIYESALAIYNINKQKIISQYKGGYFTEAEDAREAAEEAKKSFVEKTKEFFKKIKDAIVEAISKIVNKFKMMVAEKRLLKKLEQMEAGLIGEQSLLKLSHDGEIIDVKGCIKAYKDFNKTAVSYMKNLVKRKFKSKEEALIVARKLDNELEKAFEKFDLDIKNAEWVGNKIGDLIRMTKYDAEHFKNMMDEIQSEIDISIKILTELAVEGDPVVAGMAKKTANKLSNAGMKSANKILSEIIGRFSKISTAIIATRTKISNQQQQMMAREHERQAVAAAQTAQQMNTPGFGF